MTMRAIVAGDAGLELRSVPVPVPGPGQVLVRVRAAGLNRAELATAGGARHGGKGGKGAVLGLEWSGVVEAAAAATGFVPGQRVMCTGAGAYAELAVAEQGQVSLIPSESIGFAEAAALPIALRTMHNAIVGLGRLVAGETVFVHGASSGVGLMGLQVARAMGAGLVIGSSGEPGRRARLAEYGAGLAIDAGAEGWVQAVLDATGGRGVDLAVDLVSGPGINDVLRATRIMGRVINNGRLGGNQAAFDFDLHATRRITYIGTSFRTRSAAEIADINERMRADLWLALQTGGLALPIDSVFPLEQAAAAQARMRANQHFGKIVLEM